MGRRRIRRLKPEPIDWIMSLFSGLVGVNCFQTIRHCSVDAHTGSCFSLESTPGSRPFVLGRDSQGRLLGRLASGE